MMRSPLLASLVLLGCGLALAACETTSPGAPSLAAAPAPPVTHEQAAMECWMTTEKTSAHLSLDKRADLVDRCIDEKMKGAPPPKR